MSAPGGSGSGPGSATTMHMPKSAPYPPSVWTLGGAPKNIPDIPITAVFLFLFICGAVSHMTIYQLNRRKGHKFLLSGLMFGFCMARTVTTILRLASVVYATNIRLAIAAQVFVSAGVLLIYIVNLIFTQRLLRAAHPHFAWHAVFSGVFTVLYVLVFLTICAVITVVVQMFYSLNTNTHRIDRDVQLYGATWFAFVSFLPIVLVSAGLLIPRRRPLDKFGTGLWRTKIAVLLTGSALVCFGAAYRAGTLYLSPVPRSQPLPGYFGKAPFYIANFTVEILVVFLYAIARVDERFHIPNGARGPGSYSLNALEAGGDTAPRATTPKGATTTAAAAAAVTAPRANSLHGSVVDEEKGEEKGEAASAAYLAPERKSKDVEREEETMSRINEGEDPDEQDDAPVAKS